MPEGGSSKKVVYLAVSTLSERDYQRFGINIWIQRGWDVLVLDCTQFVRPKLFEKNYAESLSVNFRELQIVPNLESSLRHIDLLDGFIVFIDLLAHSTAEYKIRFAAQKKGKIVKCYVTSFPYHRVNRPTILQKSLRAISNPLRIVTHYLTLARVNNMHPDYSVVAGTESFNSKSQHKSRIIYGHNLDYDYLFNHQTTSSKHDENMIVFLDTDEAYHPDYISLGVKPHVNPAAYFSTMNHGLDLIGRSLGKKVVVAAHPRSNYSDKEHKFAFPMVKNRSYELINNAYAVVSHGSTALQWAVLKQKPILLVTTDELQKTRFFGHAEGFVVELGIDITNLNQIDSSFDWERRILVDLDKYADYKDRYIKYPGSPEQPLWSIVIDEIEMDW